MYPPPIGEMKIPGARRRYYTITDWGQKTFFRLVDEWNAAKVLIDLLIEEEKDGE